MDIVMIGLGTAAFSAILAIRKKDRLTGITVIDKKPFDLQHSCGLPYAIEGKIKLESLEHQIDSGSMNLNVLHEAEATKIIPSTNQVEYTYKGEKKLIRYDSLLLDTGSLSFLPPIRGIESASVRVVKSTKDVKDIMAKLPGVKKASVIGAGAIGIETAYALHSRGVEVTIIEAFPSLFPRAIDPDFSSVIQKYLEEKGIKVLVNSKVEEIKNEKAITTKGTIETDMVIMATGVRPNTKLAEEAGIDISKFGIVVDKKMQTSIKGIYAAGDCTEAINNLTGEKFESQLATTAYKQGTIAGQNIAGKESKYDGSISTFTSLFGNIEVACVGLNSMYAKKAGFDIVVGKSISSDKPEWFESPKKVIFKILADKKTKKILGAQALGNNAAARINVVSTAIAAGMTLDELSNVELAYCPAISQTYDVLLQAVDLALRKI